MTKPKPCRPCPTPKGTAGLTLGILAGGTALGLVAWPHRQKPAGAIALGAGASVAGVAITLLLRELLG